MDSFFKTLPDIIVYLIIGFTFVKTYRFIRIKNNKHSFQNALTEAAIYGFVLYNVYNLIPSSGNVYIDKLGMTIGTAFVAFITAKVIESDFANWARRKLKIRQTVNDSIWEDVIDKTGVTYVVVYDRETGVTTQGILKRHEPFKNKPIIQLVEYAQYTDPKKPFRDYRDDPKETILIDTSKVDSINIRYESVSDKVDECDKTLKDIFGSLVNRIKCDRHS